MTFPQGAKVQKTVPCLLINLTFRQTTNMLLMREKRAAAGLEGRAYTGQGIRAVIGSPGNTN
jgi:hypothetical protein